jgi:SAM-dependent methyltransferase
VPDLTQLAVARSYALLKPLLPPAPARILEVGCGRGALAAELGRRGWTVTGVDPDENACAAARQRGVEVVVGTLEDVDLGGLDAVLFTRSLHHLPDLAGTLQTAAGRLAPGGRLVLEEFARERADQAAAAFVYDAVDLLHAAGLADPADDPDGRPADPLERWQRQRGDAAERPLHTGAELLAALEPHGRRLGHQDCETLWRLVLSRVTDERNATAIATRVYEAERRQIDAGTLPAVGFVTAVQVG